jgi:hypothetical protein
MSFAPPGGPRDDTVLAGHLVHAQLHFYPGAGQFRGLIGEQTSATAGATMPPAESLPQIRARFAHLVAADPWATRMPAVINAAPVPGPDQWREDGRPEYLRERVHGSLQRLRLERIDLLQLHRIDPKVPPLSLPGVDALSPSAPKSWQGRPREDVEWEDVVTTGLIGTDRRPVPDALPASWGSGLDHVSDPLTRCYHLPPGIAPRRELAIFCCPARLARSARLIGCP